MKKPVIISFKGTQDDGVEKDVIELITQGSYYKKGPNYYVTYDETQLTGMEGTTTTMKIEGDKLTMMRFGQNNTQLIFEQGQTHLCCYETPHGAFTVGVCSSDVNVAVTDQGGEISASYQIEVDNAPMGVNDFTMHIREAHV